MWFASDVEEERFAHALLASLVLHVMILGYAKGVIAPRSAGATAVLSVSFRGSLAVGTEPRDQLLVPVPTRATAMTKHAAPAAVATTLAKAASVVPLERSVRRLEAHGNVAHAKTKPVDLRGHGVVDVVMLIGGDGHPQTLIWDALPALTQAQFEQLEHLIRRQVYPSTAGARLTQQVDVFSLLGLGRYATTATAATGAMPGSD